MSTTRVALQDTTTHCQFSSSGGHEEALGRIRHIIDHAAHLLPAQGPISTFIHHNTLHAFEDLTFEEAVERGAEVFGCQPYMRKDRYREALRKGRIRFADLRSVLQDDLGERANETVAGLVSRLELRLTMLQYPMRMGPASELQWFVAETAALRLVRPEAPSATRARLIAETRPVGDARSARPERPE